jgi:ATP-dependent DNA helicase PIF1
MSITLSPEQKLAYDKFICGENIFVTGPGGTGKTRLIQIFAGYCFEYKKSLQVCALTGCASLLLNCNARTIHSWSGIKLAKGDRNKIIQNVLKNRRCVSSWKKTEVLIIDEISMMSMRIFELLEEIARIIRKSNRIFGGIQIVLTGDFFQLPPVGSADEPDSEKFCFESSLWNQLFSLSNQIQLKTVFRQLDDPTYINILNEIRIGQLSEENKKILQSYVKREYNPEEHSNCIPTKLFAVRNKTDYVNNQMFSKIEDSCNEYNVKTNTNNVCVIENGKKGKALDPFVLNQCSKITEIEKEREVERLVSSLPCPPNLQLKKGAVVMCVVNYDMEIGICNGSQGIIVDFDKTQNLPIVKFANGVQIVMPYYEWCSDEYPNIVVSQIPLILSWALTIHKIQGSTMDMAEIDIGHSVFEFGQIYVALSRIRSLNGLYLLSFHPHKIRANPKVIEFYQKLENV